MALYDEEALRAHVRGIVDAMLRPEELTPEQRREALNDGTARDLRPVVSSHLVERLRELGLWGAGGQSDEVLVAGKLTVDVGAYEVRVAGRRVPFTRQEFALLRFLLKHRGRVFSRPELLTWVWGQRYDGGSRTVDIHVRRLRMKLGAASEPLETVRGVGYRFRGEDQPSSES